MRIGAPRPTAQVMQDRGGELDTVNVRGSGAVDVSQDLYPYCIVWTPIPGCTWCFPFIGHMGIGTSTGQVWEFMGFGATKAPRGGLSFGPVCRYVQLSPKAVRRGTWDDAIEAGLQKVSGRPHGACISNCHSFVADCLHEMRYGGVPCWNWLSYVLAIWLFIFAAQLHLPGTFHDVPTDCGRAPEPVVVEDSWTVDKLKEAIELESGIGKEEQQLLSGCDELWDGASLDGASEVTLLRRSPEKVDLLRSINTCEAQKTDTLATIDE
ncbi:TMEM222 [Symbiodinium natans]|uniref:TMEM222 protein n=1 Tax=Symbiodinium natans TaxID=878477 RepID=A0A812QGC6_9DINO|nr:TMEM222 [Symbiodinium natans]